MSGGSKQDALLAYGVDARLVLGVFATLVLAATALTSEVYDDPWILYRYAENLAGGEGWRFNPAVPADNAVTSPLVVLLLAAAVAVHVPVAWASGALFALGTWGTAAATYLTLRRLSHPAAGIAAGLLVIAAPPLLSLRGMEAPIYLGLLATALLLLTTQRRALLGVVLGLLVLARPDGALFVVIALLWLVARERAIPLRTIVAGALTLMPWALAAKPLTGSLVPSTLAAKEAQADSGEWNDYIPGFARDVVYSDMAPWYLLVGVVAVFGVMPAIRLWNSPLLPLAAFAVGSTLAYGLVLGVAFYPWYAALPVFVLTVVAALGFEALLRSIRVGVRAPVTASLVLVVVAAAFLTPQMNTGREDAVEVGEWIRANSDEKDRVASAELGRVGYYCGCEMVDYLGLLDQEANRHVARAEWSWWVEARRPDYWVTYREDGNFGHWVPDLAVRGSDSFQSSYERVFETDELVIFRRHD